MNRFLLVLSVVVSLVVLSCQQSFAGTAKAVFGPQVFERKVAGPESFRMNFPVCDPAGSFRLIIANGDEGGKGRVSSGTVYVNGLPVAVQGDFNQKVAAIERPVTGILEDNTIDVKLQSAPGSRITVTVEGVMNCLEVHIDSPMEGNAITDYGAVVRGTIESQDGAEVGVTVNGVPAEVCGKSFALAGIPLQPGGDTITVKAVDGSGNTAEDSVHVTAMEPDISPVYISPYPTAGLAPLDVSFTVDDSIPAEKVMYELDFEGDGVVDVFAQELSALMSNSAHSYASEGLYFPTVTVTDANGEKYFRTTVVNVFPMPDLANKWDRMKGALTAGDAEAASGYFSLSTRDGYRSTFQALADAGALAGAVAGMGEMRVVNTRGNIAEGDMRVVQDGKEYSFYVLFVKDDDGIWRIKSL
ncbi:MAG: PKD domain-containing protein [Nitrospirae bacterium]|nr:PKD domain-containing protein [Nitrospirota bacterium]